MATVSQICVAIAREIPMPLGEVQKYARALINSGDLPKAVGRSIPETTMQDRAKLILAIAATERPNLCAKPMRDRYNAPSRYAEFDMPAGDVIADQMRQIARGSIDALQAWTYSDIEVSRTGNPRVKLRVNENVRHFEGFGNVEQPEFIGGTYAAKNVEEMGELATEFCNTGLPVSAFIPGRVLITLAFGGVEEAANALIPLQKEAWRRREERQNEVMEEARAAGLIAVRGDRHAVRKAIEEYDREQEK